MAKRLEKPRDAMLRLLSERGLYNITSRIWLNTSRVRDLGFQYLAVEMLVKELGIAGEEIPDLRQVYEERFRGRKYRILLGKNSSKADAVITASPGSRLAFSWKELLELLPDPPFPLFVVDVSLKYIHTSEELEKLRLQIAVSLTTLRAYLWDRHLAITSADQETKEWFREYMGANKVIITDAKPNELLWSLGADTVIILRPDATEPLTGDDVMRANAFLIGGVVDLIPRRGISRVLDNLVPWGIPRKIVLRGSVIGVPERINRIIEILLKARYLFKGNIEKAITSTMTKKDIMRRLFVEIMKRSTTRGGTRYLSWDAYRELKKWLPIELDDFVEVARKAKVELTGSPP